MNSVIIDIVFVLFFMFMALFGFIKGFITRLYDFIGTIIACFVSYWLSKPISSIVILYSYDQSDLLSQMFGKMINQVLVFFCIISDFIYRQKIDWLDNQTNFKRYIRSICINKFC